MLKVGLTGGFGTGKTTVLGFFKKCGGRVVSADELVHEELIFNEVLKKKIRVLWGREVFEQGVLNRRALAQKVFANPRDLRKLNALLHPLVKKRLLSLFSSWRRRSKHSIVIVEVPLLFETGFDKIFDVNGVVCAKDRVAGARILKNSRFTRRDLVLRRKQQLPLDQKIALGDFVIDNNQTKKTTFEHVKKLMKVFMVWESTGCFLNH